jgi:outer membrane protein assembly factor BamE (lipoprotein component of BamABCDE complex)
MKRIPFKYLLIFLFCFLFCSCATLFKQIKENDNRQKLITTNQFKVTKGMTKAQVIELFGNPCNSQFSGDDEAWQYCYTGSGMGSNDPKIQTTWNNHYIIVWFTKSIVTGMTSYDNVAPSACENYFKSIRWEDSPGRIFEIKNR